MAGRVRSELGLTLGAHGLGLVIALIASFRAAPAAGAAAEPMATPDASTMPDGKPVTLPDAAQRPDAAPPTDAIPPLLPPRAPLDAKPPLP